MAAVVVTDEKGAWKPCKFHFSANGCLAGTTCTFSHDDHVYAAFHNLKYCPTPGCGNYCRGRQCKACHEKLLQKRQVQQQEWEARQAQKLERQKAAEAKRAAWLAREERPCQGVNCKQVTKSKFCRECAEINRRYLVPNR